MKLENNVFTKKWLPKLIFLTENFLKKIPTIFDIKDRLSKHDFATFRWTVVIHSSAGFFFFSSSMLILRHKFCFLGPTIFEIPQPNWFTNSVFFIICQQPILNFKSILQISVQSLKKAFFHSTGGEKAFNLEPVISFGYLYGEGHTDENPITGPLPYRTFVMLISLACHVGISTLTDYLFTEEKLKLKWDFFSCFRVRWVLFIE